MSLARRAVRALELGALLALLVSGCAALDQSGPTPYGSPPLHHAPGGGHVPGDTSYHGSGGP